MRRELRADGAQFTISAEGDQQRRFSGRGTRLAIEQRERRLIHCLALFKTSVNALPVEPEGGLMPK